MKPNLILIPLTALLFAATGCCTMKHHDTDHATTMSMASPLSSLTEAVAVITPSKGSTIAGTLHFTTMGTGVHIHGTVTGLDPNSTHAMHIHEFGDASAPDGMSAGGHYNPEHHMHGAPGSAEHHAGDLGNITADATGTATIDLMVDGLSIAGDKDPILGRAVVIHAKTDDFSQPVGNAGGRLGVAVIGVAKLPALMKM
jgi:Cu-Zn family superoxide dismutase